MADDCVSKKIAKLIGEGYEQDQAAAIAYSMCEAKNRGVSYVTLSEDESGWVLYGTLKLTADTYAELEPQWMSELEDDANGGHNVADLMRAVPEKYSHINFKPSDGMVTEAQRGLDWRDEFGRGGTEIGIARARDIVNRRNLSPDTVKRMKAFFDRHEGDKQGEGFSPGEDGYPSNGRIAWALWGGDAGYSWSRQRVESMEAADEKERSAPRAVQHAPNLRQVVDGALNSCQYCYFADLSQNNIQDERHIGCRKYEFITSKDWTCDSNQSTMIVDPSVLDSSKEAQENSVYPEGETTTTDEPRNAVRSFMPHTRYWNPTPLRIEDLNEVDGVIEGNVYIWGNPELVDWRPGVKTGWVEGTTYRIGIVSDVAGDTLVIAVHQLTSGGQWTSTGETVSRSTADVFAVDAYATWFDKSRPPEMAIDNGQHMRPISLEHNLDGVTRKVPLGQIMRVWFDASGLRFEASLDRSSPYFPMVVESIQNGTLHTSSATGDHTADFRNDGSFRTWWLLELALTESPAEQRIPAVTLVRSDSDTTEADQDDPRAAETNAEAPPVEPAPEGAVSPEQPVFEIDQPVSGQRSNPMELNELVQQMLNEGKTPEEIIAALVAGGMTEEEAKALLASLMPQPEAAPEVAPEGETALARAIRQHREEQLRSEVTGLRSEVTALRAAMQSAPPIKPEPVRRASGTNSNVNYNRIPDSKTRNLSASDMWFVQQALGAQGKKVGTDFTRAMYAKSVDVFQQPAKNGDEFATEFVRRFGGVRSDEIMATNISGQGTEWVGVAYAADLWEKIRVAPIYSQLVSMGMMEMSLGQGQNSIYVPTEGADPTWYSAPEANDLSSGRIEVTANPQFVGTGRVQVTPGTLKATVAWSEELDEDSLIPMAAWLNTQMARSAAEVAEYALINGDTVTTGNTNLNLIDGTPGTGASRPAYLATNGMFKLPIITTTSLSYDAGATHTEDVYLEVLKKLPNEVNGSVDDVVFLLGVREHFAALNVPAFKTRDVNAQATVENGVLTRVFGRRVLMSGQIALANSAGKIPAAGGTLGRILAVVPRYWAVVNKREVRFKLSEDPYNDAQLLRVSFRMGATYRSTTSAAAAAYEVSV